MYFRSQGCRIVFETACRDWFIPAELKEINHDTRSGSHCFRRELVAVPSANPAVPGCVERNRRAAGKQLDPACPEQRRSSDALGPGHGSRHRRAARSISRHQLVTARRKDPGVARRFVAGARRGWGQVLASLSSRARGQCHYVHRGSGAPARIAPVGKVQRARAVHSKAARSLAKARRQAMRARPSTSAGRRASLPRTGAPAQTP